MRVRHIAPQAPVTRMTGARGAAAMNGMVVGFRAGLGASVGVGRECRIPVHS